MLLRDLQRLKRIKQYCEDIQSSICRYGSSLEDFLSDSHYQHAVAFCILQIGEFSRQSHAGIPRQHQKSHTMETN